MKAFMVLALAMVAVSISHAANLNWGRFMNGHDANENEGEAVVLIEDAGGFYCTGTIIGPHWVLTSATCLNFEGITVSAGSHDLHNRKNQTHLQARVVPNKSYYVVHENFNGPFTPDIGLVYIDPPFDLSGSKRVMSYRLPSAAYVPSGEGKAYGFGSTNTEDPPSKLHAVDIDVENYETCKESFPPTAPIEPFNICAQYSKTACFLDGGGPLVQFAEGGVKVVGIVSWLKRQHTGKNNACKSASAPSVYTSVPYFVDWIHRAIMNFSVPRLP